MRARVEVTHEAGVVAVSLHGETTLMASLEAVIRGVWNARKAGTRNVLFDLRESTSEDFESRVLKQASEASRTGIGAYRVAVVGRTDDPRLPYIEEVGATRGYTVRCFVDREAALAWLREAGSEPATAA